MDIPFQSLKCYCYFSSLSEAALRALAEKLRAVRLPSGSEIIHEGDLGDSFYFINTGEVEVLKKTPKGKEALISILGNGEVFGEMALLTCSPRFATVIAKTDVVLYRLDRTDFEQIVLMDSAVSAVLKKKAYSYVQYDKIKTLEPFALLQPDQVAILLDRLKERKYAPGENIITQGEEGDVYYIVKSGRVTVLKKMFTEEYENVAVFDVGDGFGEEALLTDSRRSATVQAVDETVVWTISRDDFDHVLKSSFLEEISPQDVPYRKIGKYALLDVRTRVEFGEERIPGAVNIPLDELRQKYSSLDKTRKYYVYCLAGVRSSVAAFLLNMNGFKAKSIRGGLNSWPYPLQQGVSGVHRPTKPT